jgi:hypothetical protein
MISDKTKNTYNIVLNKLKENNINIDNPIIKELDDFYKKEKIGNSAINVYMSALLYNFKEKNIKYEYFDIIKEKMQEIRKEINKEKLIKNGKLNDKEKEKFTTWNNIIEMYKKLKELIKTNEKFKKFYMDMVIICIYKYFHRRSTDIVELYLNENYELPTDNNMILWYRSKNIKKYGGFELYDQQKVLKNKNIDKKNYYVKNTRGTFFVFNNYKTFNSYGNQIFEIPKKLEEILNVYIDVKNINNNDLLFGITENNLVLRLNNIFEIMLKKSISTSMLRHSYIQYFLKKKHRTDYEKRKLSVQMSHSIDMQSHYMFECEKNNIDIDKNINEYLSEEITDAKLEKKEIKKILNTKYREKKKLEKLQLEK